MRGKNNTRLKNLCKADFDVAKQCHEARNIAERRKLNLQPDENS